MDGAKTNQAGDYILAQEIKRVQKSQNWNYKLEKHLSKNSNSNKNQQNTLIQVFKKYGKDLQDLTHKFGKLKMNAKKYIYMDKFLQSLIVNKNKINDNNNSNKEKDVEWIIEIYTYCKFMQTHGIIDKTNSAQLWKKNDDVTHIDNFMWLKEWTLQDQMIQYYMCKYCMFGLQNLNEDEDEKVIEHSKKWFESDSTGKNLSRKIWSMLQKFSFSLRLYSEECEKYYQQQYKKKSEGQTISINTNIP